MILTLEFLTLLDGEVGFLQVLHCLVKNLWNVGSSKLTVEAIFVYLVCHHIIYNFTIYHYNFYFVVEQFQKKRAYRKYDRLFFAMLYVCLCIGA